MKKLSTKEQLWLNALFESRDLNQTEATKKIYSSKNPDALGAQIAKRPHIQEAIKSSMNERLERTQISADYVLTEAVKAFEACAKLKTTEEGHQVMVNASAACRYLEIIGKHSDVGAFKDTIIAPMAVNLVINRPRH